MAIPRLRLFFALAGAACLLTAGAACSFASLADLSNGDGDGDAGGGMRAEGGSDADTLPDAPGVDGGTDAPADGGPVGSFCEVLRPVPTFCDDFERQSPQGSWMSLDVTSGAAVSLEPSSRDGGTELVTVVPFTDAGPSATAELGRSFGPADTLSLSYAVRVDGPPARGQQQLMNVVVSPVGSADRYGVFLFASAAGIVLAEQTFPDGMGAGGNFVQHPLAQGLPYKVWTRVELLLQTTAPKRLLLKVGGEVAFDSAPDPFLRPGIFGVSAGIHYTDPPTGPLSLRIDDLVVDAK